MRNLNVIYIGQLPFPSGPASTKRRRYMVDYMNSRDISNRVLVTFHQSTMYFNPNVGLYDKTEYADISPYIRRFNLLSYYIHGWRFLKKWYEKDKKNILIFHTVMNFMDFLFYLYARKLGYKIVFDIVETSYLKAGIKSIKSYVYYWLNERFTALAKKDGAFVISSRLLETHKRGQPSLPLCLLPNSTPMLCNAPKQMFHNPISVLYAGTYGDKEGVDYLIEGVIAANRPGIRFQLSLYGNAPISLLKEYSDCPFVEFKGFVTDQELGDAMIEADVLAMVRTNTEFANYGFPFKLSEYLATGNVVIATKVGDVEDYLRDKVDAYLIEPESSDAVEQVLLYIADNPDEALQVAARGREIAERKFAPESVGCKFIDFLSKI